MSPYMACAWGCVWENKEDNKTLRFLEIEIGFWDFEDFLIEYTWLCAWRLSLLFFWDFEDFSHRIYTTLALERFESRKRLLMHMAIRYWDGKFEFESLRYGRTL